jgi:hypothetical protein
VKDRLPDARPDGAAAEGVLVDSQHSASRFSQAGPGVSTPQPSGRKKPHVSSASVTRACPMISYPKWR